MVVVRSSVVVATAGLALWQSVALAIALKAKFEEHFSILQAVKVSLILEC